MASPCGSTFGKSKNLSRPFISLELFICSNSSATSWTSSQENASFSTKKTSHNRCFLTILAATFLPPLVKKIYHKVRHFLYMSGIFIYYKIIHRIFCKIYYMSEYHWRVYLRPMGNFLLGRKKKWMILHLHIKEN